MLVLAGYKKVGFDVQTSKRLQNRPGIDQKVQKVHKNQFLLQGKGLDIKRYQNWGIGTQPYIWLGVGS